MKTDQTCGASFTGYLHKNCCTHITYTGILHTKECGLPDIPTVPHQPNHGFTEEDIAPCKAENSRVLKQKAVAL